MEMRRLQYEDLSTRVEWMNDERVNRTLNIKLPVTLESTIEWFERVKDRDDRVDFAFVDDGKLVAMGGIVDVDRSVGKAEVYVFVSPDSFGLSFGRVSLKTIIVYGFDELRLSKIYAYTNSNNLICLRMCKKVGFVEEGLLRREIYKNGQLLDRYYLGILKEEFKY